MITSGNQDKQQFERIVTGELARDGEAARALLARRPDLALKLQRIEKTAGLLDEAFSEEREFLKAADRVVGAPGKKGEKAAADSIAEELSRGNMPHGAGSHQGQRRPLHLLLAVTTVAAALALFLGLQLIDHSPSEKNGNSPDEFAQEEPSSSDDTATEAQEDLELLAGSGGSIQANLRLRRLVGTGDLELSWDFQGMGLGTKVTVVVLDAERHEFARVPLSSRGESDTLTAQETSNWPPGSSCLLEFKSLAGSIDRSVAVPLPPR